MKKFTIIFLTFIINCSFLITISNAQTYFVDENGKQINCKKLIVQTASDGSIMTLIYTTNSGQNKQFRGKNKCPQIQKYCQKGAIYELIPEDANKPDGAKRFSKQVVNGKLKVYYDGANRAYSVNKQNLEKQKENRLFILTEDGKYLDANDKKSMKKVIIPLLASCPKFHNQYRKEFSSDPTKFIEMIKFYNEICE